MSRQIISDQSVAMHALRFCLSSPSVAVVTKTAATGSGQPRSIGHADYAFLAVDISRRLPHEHCTCESITDEFRSAFPN
ncbi:hypothetical protein [Microvirga antarctica]|uniref:hypothetical protein n=1 Tax=Microvirga antarctica TaxID=2819233 RepID=UPI001B307E53|nr:hypothetical protein [Microvirga antarctica]